MLQIILAIIVICIAFTIIKKVGGFVLKLLKCIFRLIFGLIYLAISGPAILCTKIFYGLTKLLHIQSFAYYLLSLCSLPSFVYLCAVHIPYSKKERFINCKSFFAPKKKTRNETIAMACFLTLEGLFLCALPSIVKIEKDSAYCLYLLGAIYVLGAFIYSLVKISKWKKENQAISSTNTTHNVENNIISIPDEPLVETKDNDIGNIENHASIPNSIIVDDVEETVIAQPNSILEQEPVIDKIDETITTPIVNVDYQNNSVVEPIKYVESLPNNENVNNQQENENKIDSNNEKNHDDNNEKK